MCKKSAALSLHTQTARTGSVILQLKLLDNFEDGGWLVEIQMLYTLDQPIADIETTSLLYCMRTRANNNVGKISA